MGVSPGLMEWIPPHETKHTVLTNDKAAQGGVTL